MCAHSFCPSKLGEVREDVNSPPIPGASTVLPHYSPMHRRCCGPACRAEGRRVKVFLKPTTASELSGPPRYIVDSGAAYHIANSGECSKELLAGASNLDPALEMSTVNGRVTVTDGFKIEVPALKKGMEFALLPHSPSLISLGRLCMLDGFSLHWP